MRVYRLTADDGTHLIGRVVPANQIDVIRMKLGLDRGPARQLSARERMEELMARRCKYLLDQDLVLSGRRHMGLMRVEIEHRGAGVVERLKSLGCRSEIVQYRTRVFVPDSDTMERVLAEYPVLARHDTRTVH